MRQKTTERLVFAEVQLYKGLKNTKQFGIDRLLLEQKSARLRINSPGGDTVIIQQLKNNV
jgi:hypothetical protein